MISLLQNRGVSNSTTTSSLGLGRRCRAGIFSSRIWIGPTRTAGRSLSGSLAMSTTISVEMAQGTSPKRLRHCCSSRVAAVQLSTPAPVGYQWQPDGWPGPFLSSAYQHVKLSVTSTSMSVEVRGEAQPFTVIDSFSVPLNKSLPQAAVGARFSASLWSAVYPELGEGPGPASEIKVDARGNYGSKFTPRGQGEIFPNPPPWAFSFPRAASGVGRSWRHRRRRARLRLSSVRKVRCDSAPKRSCQPDEAGQPTGTWALSR